MSASQQVRLAVDHASGGSVPAAFIQSKSAADTFNPVTTITCTFTSNVTSGNLICVAVWWDSVITTITVSDSLGNSYTLDATSKISDVVNLNSMQFAYAKNISGGSCTVTVTFSSASTNKAMAVYEASGCSASSPVSGSIGKNVGSVGAGSNGIDTGAWTTTKNNGIIISAMMSEGFSGGTVTAGTSSETFTLDETQNASSQMFNAEHALQAIAGASTHATFTPAGFTSLVLQTAIAFGP